MLTYDKSLTNLEHLRTLGAHTEIQRALRPAIQVFDDVWYGHKPCDTDTTDKYREMLKKRVLNERMNCPMRNAKYRILSIILVTFAFFQFFV